MKIACLISQAADSGLVCESEQSASSLSQSEGIQAASATEYKGGQRQAWSRQQRRISARCTDTIDSHALFMGPPQMPSHWVCWIPADPKFVGFCMNEWHLSQLFVVTRF